jgi:hypothetical protein
MDKDTSCYPATSILLKKETAESSESPLPDFIPVEENTNPVTMDDIVKRVLILLSLLIVLVCLVAGATSLAGFIIVMTLTWTFIKD